LGGWSFRASRVGVCPILGCALYRAKPSRVPHMTIDKGVLDSTAECALCSKDVVNLAHHLVLSHGVRGPEHYQKLLQAGARRYLRAEQFREFIAAQTSLREKGLISSEEFRNRCQEWERSHPEEDAVQ
jgi:hypothetical protein